MDGETAESYILLHFLTTGQLGCFGPSPTHTVHPWLTVHDSTLYSSSHCLTSWGHPKTGNSFRLKPGELSTHWVHILSLFPLASSFLLFLRPYACMFLLSMKPRPYSINLLLFSKYLFLLRHLYSTSRQNPFSLISFFHLVSFLCPRTRYNSLWFACLK